MCDYCRSCGKTLGNTGEILDPVFSYANCNIIKGKLSLQLVFCGAEYEVKTPIKFCPMCGRNLEKKG